MDTVEDWISLREFARRREVSLGAVQKAIASGRVTSVKREDNGRITAIAYHAATREWNGNTDIDQAARAGAPILPPSMPTAQPSLLAPLAADPEPPAAPPVTPANDQDARYLNARAHKQEFEAKQAELDYLKALGLVVATEDLQRVSSARYASVRDKLLNIPDRMATVLAAEREPARVHAALTGEIKRVLNELADDAEREAAGRAAQRVAA